MLISTKRTNYIIYTLITNRYATYKELRDDYTIDEVLNLYEICLVNLYNRHAMIERRS